MVQQERESFQKWYEENREDYNRKRRERFQNDPEYRKRVRAQRRRYKRKKARERAEARKVKPRKGWRSYDEAVDTRTGDTVSGEFFTVSALATALGVTAQMVRRWERSGKLERTPFESTSGYRLYSLDRIEDLAEQREDLTAKQERPRGHSDFSAYRTEHDGRTLYSSGALAQILGITTEWLRALERRGDIPTADHASSRGRLYTLEQLQAAAQAVVDYDQETKRIKRDWTRMSAFLNKRWPSPSLHPTGENHEQPAEQQERAG